MFWIEKLLWILTNHIGKWEFRSSENIWTFCDYLSDGECVPIATLVQQKFKATSPFYKFRWNKNFQLSLASNGSVVKNSSRWKPPS